VDKTLATPAVFNVASLNLNATGITNKPGAELPFNLGLKLNDEGFLKLKGQAVLEPLSSNLQLDLGNIAIKDFQPYFDKFARLDVISGLFNVNAKISLLQEEDKPLGIKMLGDSHIDNLVTRDQVSNKDFLNWKRLSLDKIDIDLAANRYTINTVKIEEPYTRVLIRKDKTTNISDLIIQAPQEASSTVKQESIDASVVKQETVDKKEQIEPYFKIGKIEMVGGESDFSDLSLFLPFKVNMNQLKGTVKGISSEKNTVTNIAMDGRVGGLSPVKIIGKINPDKGDSELSLDFKSLSLPLVTPYMAEFAGRRIEKGNMSLKLKYKIVNNQLSASNEILIDQLVLGEEVEHENAVSLPLDFAIALLQDSDGKIALDVPITGNLENPEFSVAAIVTDALINVITKVISSPFNAIASLIGSDEDISKVMFSSGDTVLDDKQKKKLDGLAEALSKRPGLKLEITGTAFSQYDWPQLQAEALDKQLLQIRVDELNQDSKKKISEKDVTLTKDEYDRLLADVFIQKFPELAERSLFGAPQLKDPEMGDFYQIANTRLAAIIPPDPLRLQQLATVRAKSVAKYLVEKDVVIERIFLLDVDVDPKDSDDTIATILNLAVD
jgi:outer membrane protein OmpA-like peptidoglycan-associated protein